MPILSSSGTYQGLPVQAIAFRRSPGLEPEYSTVDLLLSDIKKVDVQVHAIAWGAINATQVPSGCSIEVWARLRATVSVGGETARPSGGGLAQAGTLILQSTVDGKPIGNPVRYDGIFVAPDGIEEVGAVTADRRAHSSGRVRIAITDVRAYYADNGCFIGGINVVDKRTGNFHPETVKGGRAPWSIQEVIPYLFSQLPGSPLVNKFSDLYKVEAGAPLDLVGEGEPIKQYLANLLDRYGLVASLMPSGNEYMVNRAVSGKVKYGTIPVAPNSFAPVQYVADERKSVAITGRPNAVLVVGRRRVPRHESSYIPAFQDPEDSRYYRLADVGKRIKGYTIEKVNRQVFQGSEKAFRDIGKPSRTVARQMRALRDCAYRLYAPASAFDGTDSISDEDLRRNPFLPMVDAAWFIEDLKKIGAQVVVGAKAGSSWLLRGPMVFGARFAQGYYADFDALEEFFREMKDFHAGVLENLRAQAQKLRQQAASAADVLSGASQKAASNFDMARAAKLGFGDVALAYLEDKSRAALSKVGLAMSPDAAERLMAQVYANYRGIAARLSREIASITATIQDQSSVVRKYTQHWESVKDTFRAIGGVQVWHNHPWGIISSGYTLDPRTGVLKFSEPFCMAAQSFMFTPEGATVAADGGIRVVWGYERSGMSALDYTSSLYVSGDDGVSPASAPGEASVAWAGVCRTSSICPKVVRDPSLRLYEDEFGNPINASEVIAQGAARAAGALTAPKAGIGFIYNLYGFQMAVLESGVSGVQYTWDPLGGQSAQTVVAVNAPGARAPVGVPKLNRRTPVDQAAASENQAQVPD